MPSEIPKANEEAIYNSTLGSNISRSTRNTSANLVRRHLEPNVPGEIGGSGPPKSRSSQPLPTTPSTGSSGGTPNASKANTAIRGRSMSAGGTICLLHRQVRKEYSRHQWRGERRATQPNQLAVGYPSTRCQRAAHSAVPASAAATGHGRCRNPVIVDQNQIAMAQQIKSLNKLNMQLNQMFWFYWFKSHRKKTVVTQLSMNDLPPTSSIPEQLSPQQSLPPPPPPGKLSAAAACPTITISQMHLLKKIPPREKIRRNTRNKKFKNI